MCLSQITKTYSKRDKTEGFGWKVVSINDNDTFRFPFFHNSKSNRYNQWLRRVINKVNDFCTVEYDSGFHIFKTRKDARTYKGTFSDEKIVKVQYKGIVCEGFQKDYNANTKKIIQLRCLVVKQIKVLK